MIQIYTRNNRQLYHHGILGQQWGKRNGPPYPLGSSDHSPRERRLGWRKSLDKKPSKQYNKSKGLTDEQKTALKVGAIATGTALAVVGGVYLAKTGKLDDLIMLGRSRVGHVVGDSKSGSIGDSAQKVADSVAKQTKESVERVNGFKKLPRKESIDEAIKNANPLKGTVEGKNNCSACGFATFMRMQGYDVVAKSTNGEMQNMNGMVEECFKNAKVIDGSAIKFGKSPEDASQMLTKKFGENAQGVCAVQWFGKSSGHVFNWAIKDGSTEFFDGKNGQNDATIRKLYWRMIDKYGNLQIARLDNAEIIPEKIAKYVE